MVHWRRLWPAVLIAAAACEVGEAGPPPLTSEPGVIFSYPHDGQRDVPLGARLVVSFTDPVDVAAVTAGCSVGADGGVVGAFCVRGPDGLVATSVLVAGPKDNVVLLERAAWEAGATYEVFVRPAVLWGKATNLDDAPLLRFTAGNPRSMGGHAPTVIAVNGDDPAAYVAGSGATPRFPFVDFTTIRVALSEPLDPGTVAYGDTVRLVDADGAQVEAALLAQGAHLTIDPVADLTTSPRYRLELGAGLRDLSGDALAPVAFELAPLPSRVGGRELAQVLACIPGREPSYAAGGFINQVELTAPLIGDATIAMVDNTLAAVMANPAGFGPLIPLTLRKGQRLTMQPLPVKLGGELATPLVTGPLQVQMAADATVYLARNPFRDPARLPDDELAPVAAYLAFDVVVTATDAVGNAALNQQVLGVQATGLARVYDGGLEIDSVGGLDLDLLGLDRATSNMVLRLSTTTARAAPGDDAPPRVTSTFPADGARDVPADAALRVTFGEGIDAAAATRDGAVTLTGAAAVPVRVRVEGSTLIVTPRQPLAYGAAYTLEVSGMVRDLAGTPAAPTRLGFRTVDLTTSAPAPLALVAARPGVPCALDGATATSPGRCRDGASSDDRYAPFALAADLPVELTFQQPLDRGTVTLGAACGTGSVRVEVLDPSGACSGVARGRLVVGEDRLSFIADAGWAPGARYRVVIHGGDDGDCDPGELCGRNRLPFNSDVLDGLADRGDAGGADLVLPFVAAAASADRYAMTTRTWPVADGNGNGVLDAGEVASSTNRAALRIVGTSGMVRSATLNGPDCVPGTPAREACMYLSGALPVTMGTLQHGCTIDGATVAACIPVELSPQILYGTSLSMNATVAVIGTLSDQRTQQLVLRLRTPPGQPLMSHIVVGADGQAALRARLPLYLDAPSMKLLAGLAGHDLASKPITVDVAGPVAFTADGRIQISLANVAAVPLAVELSAIGIGIGTIAMEIPAGEMKMQLVGDAATGGR